MRTPAHTQKAFGARLRSLRERKGLTQQQLAQAAGIHREDLVRLETGSRPVNPTAARLIALANALGVGLGDLYPKSRAA